MMSYSISELRKFSKAPKVPCCHSVVGIMPNLIILHSRRCKSLQALQSVLCSLVFTTLVTAGLWPCFLKA